MTGFGLNRAVSGLTQGGEQASASKDKAALVLGQGAMWPWLWELAQRTERLAYEASSPAAPWYVSLFSRRTADGPKRKPLPWRRRWHWLRSSCEPGGRSRKSAAPWAVSDRWSGSLVRWLEDYLHSSLSRSTKIYTPGRKEQGEPMTPRRTPARFGL